MIPLTLGMETVGGVMDKMILRNAKTPCKQTRNFTTNRDNQENLLIKVYEGERALVKENNLLGSFRVGGIPKMAKGKASIDVTFDVDNDGILKVSAMENSSGKLNECAISNDKKLSNEAIIKMLEEAKKYEAEDKAIRDRVLAVDALEALCL